MVDIRDLFARIISAGPEGLTVGELARDTGVSEADALGILRPEVAPVRLELTGGGDRSSLSSPENRVADDVFVISEPSYIGESRVIDRRAEVGTLSLTLNEAAGLLDLLRRAPIISFVLSGIEISYLTEQLRRLLPRELRGRLPLDIDPDFDGDDARLRSTLKTLSTAMLEARQVHLVYMSESASLTTRAVDPLELRVVKDGIVLEAFCHLRREERLFRVDRVLAATVLGKSADNPPTAPYL